MSMPNFQFIPPFSFLPRPFRYDLNQIPYDYTVEMTNKFKGLALIECLKNHGWRFVTLYRRQWSPRKLSQRERKAKWLSEEVLQIAEKRGEAKGKGEKESYTHLSAEFQRLARRDKKAFLSNQCKEIEENNRKGKTRDLFKGSLQGNISCKDEHNTGQKWYGPNRSRRH